MVIAVRTERRSSGLEVVKHADSDADRLRLQREAQVLARAAHPGVVEIVDANPAVLRLRHGGTSLRRLAPLAPDHAAAIVRSVASTVADLHQLGVAHGRVDLDHVVVDADGRPRLCGFAEAGEAGEAARAADVAALGQMLTELLDLSGDALWSPPLRGLRATARRTRALRGFRAAATAALHAPTSAGPSARQFAAALLDALPELSLPSGSPSDGGARDEPAPPAVPGGPSTIPAELDPTAELSWTDEDLTFLAETSGDDEWGPPAAAPDEPGSPAGPDVGPGSAPDIDPGARASVRIRPPRSASRPSEAVSRRALAGAAIVVLILGVVAGSALARAIRPFGDDSAVAVRSTDDEAPEASGDAADGEPVPSADGEADAAAAGSTDPLRPPSFAEGCEVPALPGPDVDDDGCPDPVTLEGRTAQVGPVRVELGAEGDVVALGDPDCDGVVTPAVLRPATGEVFLFEAWSLSEPVEIEAAVAVVDASAITGASCAPFVVSTIGGDEVPVGVPDA